VLWKAEFSEPAACLSALALACGGQIMAHNGERDQHAAQQDHYSYSPLLGRG